MPQKITAAFCPWWVKWAEQLCWKNGQHFALAACRKHHKWNCPMNREDWQLLAMFEVRHFMSQTEREVVLGREVVLEKHGQHSPCWCISIRNSLLPELPKKPLAAVCPVWKGNVLCDIICAKQGAIFFFFWGVLFWGIWFLIFTTCQAVTPSKVTSYVQDGPVKHALKPWGFTTHPKGSMPQCALVIGVSDQEKLSQKKNGAAFPLFDDENCKNPMAPKYYWKNCTAFPPVWMMKFPKWNGWKMFIEKFGQHFPLFWGWKAKKWNGWKILLEKIGAALPLLMKSWNGFTKKNVLGKNWAALPLFW